MYKLSTLLFQHLILSELNQPFLVKPDVSIPVSFFKSDFIE